jgi:transposase
VGRAGALDTQAPRREDGKGRLRRANREVPEDISRVLRTGAQCADLPEKCPPYQACHPRFQGWADDGILKSVLEALAQDLEARGELDLSECFIDGTFVATIIGGSALGRLSGARVAGSWQLRTLLVLASPSTLALFRRMKSAWCTKLSQLDTLRVRLRS